MDCRAALAMTEGSPHPHLNKSAGVFRQASYKLLGRLVAT